MARYAAWRSRSPAPARYDPSRRPNHGRSPRVAVGYTGSAVRKEGCMVRETVWGGRRLQWGGRTVIMGILNLTDDSFSGDGLDGDAVRAAAQARCFVDEGADLLDIGGESTRPGHLPVTEDEELR